MPLFRHRKSVYWWCRFKVCGRTHRISARTTDRRKAEVEERRLRALHESAAPHRRSGGAVDVPTLAGWDADRAVSAGADSTRGATLEWIWSPLAKFFGDRLAWQIGEQDIEAYISGRRIVGEQEAELQAKTGSGCHTGVSHRNLA